MIDVHYEDVDADWRGAMARIYDFLDLDIEHAWPAMEAYYEEAATLKGRPHRYSLAEFGLTEREVMARLGDYVRDFAVPQEQTAAGLRY